MEQILERYERYSYAERQLIGAQQPVESQANWSLEYPKLLARKEVLQRNISHFVGEDLENLSLRELQSLEQQIDIGLKRVRTRKNQAMHESISELQKKEKVLHEQNNMLAKKVKENEKTMSERAQWEQQNQLGQNSPPFMLPPPTPTLPLPSLTIGTNNNSFHAHARGMGNEDDHRQNMPPWMLRHPNE